MEEKEIIDLMQFTENTTVSDEEAAKTYPKILETVLSKMEYLFTKELLVKPLPKVMVEKTVTVPVNMEINDAQDLVKDYETEEHTQEVEANFARGIVLALPTNYQWKTQLSDGSMIDATDHPEVGDEVVYSKKGMITFDIFKDTEVVNPYSVVAWKKMKKIS